MAEAQTTEGAVEMTVDAWAALDEDQPGELVDGRLEEEEMPTILHELVVAWLVSVLHAWARPRGGFVLGSEAKLIVGARRGRKPDVSAYLPGHQLPARSAAATTRPPTLVVEVLSPRPRDVRRDVVDKLADYATFGVQHYWLVDPLARTVDIRRLDPGGRHVTLLSAADGVLPVPEHDGLVLDLDGLWREVDEVSDEPEERG